MNKKQIETRSRFWRRWATYFVWEAAELKVSDKDWEPAYNMACKANARFRK